MKAVKNKNKILNNQKGQGMVEYILLIVVVVGLIFAFKPRLTKMFNDSVGKAEGDINQVIQ